MKETFYFVGGVLFGFILALKLVNWLFKSKEHHTSFRLNLDSITTQAVEKALKNDNKADLLMVSYTIPMEDAKKAYKRDNRIINACAEFGEYYTVANSVSVGVKTENYKDLVNAINLK